MKTLYFDCFAGASGDMILGALIALGADEKKLLEQLKTLAITDFKVEFETVDRSGINAVKADVQIAPDKAHRHFSQIEKIIGDSGLNEKVKTRAIKIFRKLAEAEAKIHGIEIEKVHFHEVGAMDAISEVVGACVGVELLEIERFICSKIHVGSGFVQMAHGKFPVPPPAVAELLRGVSIYSTDIEGELITPTGAAIIATVCEEFGAIPEMKIERAGYGAGTREYKNFPNVLRLIIGEISPEKQSVKNDEKQTTDDNLIKEKILILETNIDDLSPEILGSLMEKSLALGALDCWFTAIQMKKNRPATMVSILCRPNEKEKFLALVFTETSTLGVRVSTVERNCLPRETVRVETAFGSVDVKTAKFGGRIVNMKPEFEQVKKIADRTGLPARRVIDEIETNFKSN
ncbi:MAG: nickel pincer cofactor biosynthesis protein LarC [Pyrinomonadaceae bacterium]